MKKLLLALYSPLLMAQTIIETPVIEITQGWKSLPIIVNDNQDYFYSHARFCPPEVDVLPHPCNKKRIVEVAPEEELPLPQPIATVPPPPVF